MLTLSMMVSHDTPFRISERSSHPFFPPILGTITMVFAIHMMPAIYVRHAVLGNAFCPNVKF